MTKINNITVKKNRSKKATLLFAASSFSLLIYIIWRTFYTLPFGYGWLSVTLGVILLTCEVVSGVEALNQYMNMMHIDDPEMPPIPIGWYSDVDMFIMTHNESEELLFKTINGCTYMDYPDKSKVHIYVCDDMNRPSARALAERMGVGYIGMAGNTHAKAGNFNNALFQTYSPLVATVDADMIPRRDFLMQIVPYFFLPKMKKDEKGVWVPREEHEIDENYKIGFIQSSQSFYNPDLFQFNLHAENRVPNEQDFFFREVNVGRNRVNASIFAGSNAVLSRDALLAVGGMSTDTITEDFETGMKIQEKGYITYSISKSLAHGLAPNSLDSLLSQRERWGRGCIQSMRNFKPYLPGNGLSLGARISYIWTYIYWWTFVRRFFFIIIPILAVLFNVVVLRCSFWQLIAFWLPYYILHDRTMKVMSGSIRTQYLSNLVDTILCPYMVVPIVLESLGIKKQKFVVTKKDYKNKPMSTVVFALPHLILLVASFLAFVLCTVQTIQTRSLYNVIIMFWLVVNGKNLLLAVFFMVGRQNYRKAERFYVSVPAKIFYGGRVFSGITTDISETGMCVCLEYPEYLPDDGSFEIQVSSPPYNARMCCSVAHVDSKPNGWRYSLCIDDIDEADCREYLQIVFDRNHTLADSVKDPVTIYDDLSLNIGKRLGDDHMAAIRKLPRIHVLQAGTLDDGGTAVIIDFNYKYAWIHSDIPLGTEAFSVGFEPGHYFELKAVDGIQKGNRQGALYHVLNWQSLLADKAFLNTVRYWAEQGENNIEALLVPGAV